MKLRYFIVLITVLSSCNKDHKEEQTGTDFKNDFESIAGWTNIDTTLLLRCAAHSGNYAALTDTVHPYSLGYIRKLKYISQPVPRKIDLELWTLAKSFEADAVLVFSIESGGKSVIYKSMNVIDSVGATNRWYPIRSTYELPKDLSEDDELRVYIWNRSNDTVLVDDFRLQFN